MMGYATAVPASGEIRYRFNPRKQVPDERLFGGVAAELRVEGLDDAGVETTDATRVTVTR
jgi:hypothetical protein